MIATVSARQARPVLGRLSKPDLIAISESLDVQPDARSKTALVQAIDDQLGGVPADVVAEHDLAYAMADPSTRKWTLMRGKSASSGASELLDEKTLRALLLAELRPFFDTHVHVRHGSGLVWIRLFLLNRAKLRADERTKPALFAVHKPRTAVVACSAIPGPEQECVLGALGRSLGLSALQPSAVTSHSLASVLATDLHRHSQGAHSAYRLQAVDGAPLADSVAEAAGSALGRRVRRVNAPVVRAAQVALEEVTARGGFVIDEEAPRQIDRVLEGEEAFGMGQARALEAVTLNTRGDATIRGSRAGPLSVSIRLEGSNVTEGLRALVERGALAAPVPDFLRRLVEAEGGEIDVPPFAHTARR